MLYNLYFHEPKETTQKKFQNSINQESLPLLFLFLRIRTRRHRRTKSLLRIKDPTRRHLQTHRPRKQVKTSKIQTQ